MLTRRLFLGALVAAPAVVRAESLMKIWVPPEPKVVPFFPHTGDGWVIQLTDDIREGADRLCGLPSWRRMSFKDGDLRVEVIDPRDVYPDMSGDLYARAPADRGLRIVDEFSWAPDVIADELRRLTKRLPG